ncbi:MAG: LLM class F420-dependent oxidoreductase [Alphaproteobacteria bacterium]|nr:LLM class F420-dependent oxidoreductase [Alphaproteobacteria bacterium]
MKLGLRLEMSGAQPRVPMDLVLEAERVGFDSVWSSESWGSDAVAPAAWVLAQTARIKAGTSIMQIPARTPAMAAMTALTLDALSGGRFVLGIGPSGPQVVEGWHGVAYGKPIQRTREYVEVIRKIVDRAGALTHSGEFYQIPYTGPGASGLGKPLKSIIHANRALKIYIAAITPAGIRNAAEIADGMFPVFMSPERFDVFESHLEAGFAKTGSKRSLTNFDICPFVPISLHDDVEQARLPIKQHLAFYIGGMGAREKNFYNDYAKRLGYDTAAAQIQDAFLSGRRKEAVAAVPDELVDEVALAGPAPRIRRRLEAWKSASARRHVDTILLGTNVTSDALQVIATAVHSP